MRGLFQQLMGCQMFDFLLFQPFRFPQNCHLLERVSSQCVPEILCTTAVLLRKQQSFQSVQGFSQPGLPAATQQLSSAEPSGPDLHSQLPPRDKCRSLCWCSQHGVGARGRGKAAASCASQLRALPILLILQLMLIGLPCPLDGVSHIIYSQPGEAVFIEDQEICPSYAYCRNPVVLPSSSSSQPIIVCLETLPWKGICLLFSSPSSRKEHRNEGACVLVKTAPAHPPSLARREDSTAPFSKARDLAMHQSAPVLLPSRAFLRGRCWRLG
ncbi:uncharacterized protein LOC114679432 [Macaca mulatta]